MSCNVYKAVYEAIRNSPIWNTSLLVIVYDEHGGFYDSVKPGLTIPPGDGIPGFLQILVKTEFECSQLNGEDEAA